MTQYIIRRLLLAVPTLLIIIFAVFMIMRLVPGSIVDIILAENPYATEGDKEAMEKELGLYGPIHEQFARYLGELARGDLGTSPWTGEEVTTELKNRLPVTLEFGTMAILIGLIIALPVGIVSAIRQDTWQDYVWRSFAILALSVPYFFTATLLVVFPVMWWGWSPPLIYKPWSSGVFSHLEYFFWPALLLGVTLSGTVMRLTRTQMLEVLRQDYIRTAWSKGLRERVIISRHALKNALIPVVTVIGLQIRIAVGGTLILETIFNMPGIGRYYISAIPQRDYPSIQGVALVIALIVVVSNLVVDLTYGWLDPRIRYS